MDLIQMRIEISLSISIVHGMMLCPIIWQLLSDLSYFIQDDLHTRTRIFEYCLQGRNTNAAG